VFVLPGRESRPLIERILVVDRDLHSLAFARQTLEEAGYDVLTAEDGEGGLQAAFSERPDLIVLNGTLVAGQDSLYRWLGENPRTADIPVILLASGLEVEEGWMPDDHLLHPFDVEQLLEKVRRLMVKTPRRGSPICTGNSALDEALGGGIPVGSLTLIEGEAGMGKSALARQIIWEALQGGLILTLFTSEHCAQSLVGQMREVGLNVLDFLLRDQLSVYPLNLGRLRAHALQTLLYAMKWGVRRKVMVVDPLSAAFAHSSAEETRRFFKECKALCQGGSTVIVTLHSYDVTADLLDSIQPLCDVHLKLHPDDEYGASASTVEVCKARGNPAAPGTTITLDPEPEARPLDVPATHGSEARSNGRRMAG
jgi:flagellar protein FlaH